MRKTPQELIESAITLLRDSDERNHIAIGLLRAAIQEIKPESPIYIVAPATDNGFGEAIPVRLEELGIFMTGDITVDVDKRFFVLSRIDPL